MDQFLSEEASYNTIAIIQMNTDNVFYLDDEYRGGKNVVAVWRYFDYGSYRISYRFEDLSSGWIPRSLRLETRMDSKVFGMRK